MNIDKLIRWDTRTNCITEWLVPSWSRPLRFVGWGCEIGNWFGFFAHERLDGTSCKILDRKLYLIEDSSIGSTWLIKLPHARFSVEVLDEFRGESCIVRRLTIRNSSCKVSWIGDVAIRTVVPWEEGLVAKFEGTVIQHKDRNFYYDTEEKAVALYWKDGRQLNFTWVNRPNFPLAFTPYLYIRDQPARPEVGHLHCATRAWVVHARVIVDYPAAFVYRLGRNPFVLWNRGFLGRFIVKPHRLGHRWRAAEWKLLGRGSLYGVWPMLPGDQWSMSLKINAS
ncbi:MAG TPA: hypothetical protein ENG73_11330 [Desulfobacterales bacterium]|nr:hypothetical protein [Desulfobacterales bacterium]